MKPIFLRLLVVISLFGSTFSANSQSSSIYDNISSNQEFSSFRGLVDLAHTQGLKNEGDSVTVKTRMMGMDSLTVFVPLNSCFNASVLDSLKSDTSLLKGYLGRHIHLEPFGYDELFNSMVLNSYAGTKINVSRKEGENLVKVKEGGKRTLANLVQEFPSSNGLILSIDNTFIPAPPNFDSWVDSKMEPATGFLNSIIFAKEPFTGMNIPWVLIWLVTGAVIFTFYMRFINVRGFKHALDVVRGRYDDPDDAGEVSHFQALTAALSGTVGVGNIAGVAVALSIGGPGATFWMIVAGLIGMSSKFVECTLGLKYRKINPDGSVSGGPMYYLSKGLASKGFSGFGKVLAVIFAIACIGGSFGGGNMVQANQALQQLISITGGDASWFDGNGWVFGLIMAVVVGVVIIGGIKSIANVTDKIVPFMVGIYVLAALIVILYNIDKIGWAFGQIFNGAFSETALYGGIIGVVIQGFRRAAFSNEAGIGSASIAHSAAKTDEPVSEGIVALLEPFIDTVVICTMTALVIIFADYGTFTPEQAFYNADNNNLDGILITSSAFEQTIGWFPYILAIAVILFALSTMISWSYYGLKAWTYLFGESNTSQNSYRIIFCLFIIIGSAISAQQVFDFGDIMIFAMCFPNILGLYFLMPEVRKDLKSYMSRIKSGEIKKFK